MFCCDSAAGKLKFDCNRRTLELDLTQVLTAKVYCRPEKREMTVRDFAVSLRRSSGNVYDLTAESARFGLVVNLRFELGAESVRLTVDPFQILELRGSTYRLMELSVLPGLLAAKQSDHIEWLLPAFSGALVEPAKLAPGTCRNRFYMSQQEWEKFGVLNCFAVTTDAASCLAIVESGDFYAWCDSVIGAECCQSFVTFGMRHTPDEVLSSESKTVVYYLRPGRVGWAKLSQIYRDDLLNRRGVMPLADRVKDNPVLAYAADAIRVKIFCAVRPKMVPDGSSEMAVFTTFEEAETIIQTFYDHNIRKVIFTLVGWNVFGHDGAYPTRFPAEPRLGGESGLKKLIAKARALDYQIVCHDNVTDAYLQSPDMDYDMLSVDEFGERQISGIWAGGESYKMCPVVYLERYGHNLKRIKDLGFYGSAYLDAQTTGLFTCHHPKHPANEREFALALCRMLEYVRHLYGASSCECGAAYVLPYVDEVAHVHGQGVYERFRHKISDEFNALKPQIVPFFQLATHGLVISTHKLERGFDPLCRPWHEVEFRAGGYGDHYLDVLPLICEHAEIMRVLQNHSLSQIVGYDADDTKITITFDHHITIIEERATKSIRILRDQHVIYQSK